MRVWLIFISIQCLLVDLVVAKHTAGVENWQSQAHWKRETSPRLYRRGKKGKQKASFKPGTSQQKSQQGTKQTSRTPIASTSKSEGQSEQALGQGNFPASSSRADSFLPQDKQGASSKSLTASWKETGDLLVGLKQGQTRKDWLLEPGKPPVPPFISPGPLNPPSPGHKKLEKQSSSDSVSGIQTRLEQLQIAPASGLKSQANIGLSRAPSGESAWSKTMTPGSSPRSVSPSSPGSRTISRESSWGSLSGPSSSGPPRSAAPYHEGQRVRPSAPPMQEDVALPPPPHTQKSDPAARRPAWWEPHQKSLQTLQAKAAKNPKPDMSPATRTDRANIPRLTREVEAFKAKAKSARREEEKYLPATRSAMTRADQGQALTRAEIQASMRASKFAQVGTFEHSDKEGKLSEVLDRVKRPADAAKHLSTAVRAWGRAEVRHHHAEALDWKWQYLTAQELERTLPGYDAMANTKGAKREYLQSAIDYHNSVEAFQTVRKEFPPASSSDESEKSTFDDIVPWKAIARRKRS